MACDEAAGWLGSFTRYKSGKGDTDRPRWLSLYDSGIVDIDRKTGEPRTIRLRNTLVGVCGGIQPAVLRAAMTADAVASGLFARILMVYPPDAPAEWSDAEIDDSVMDDFVALLTGLRRLEHDRNPAGKPWPHLVYLSGDAKDRFRRYFNANRRRAFDAATDGGSATLVKLEAYTLRFALLRHACRYVEGGDGKPLADADMAAGIELAEWFAYELARVTALVGEDEEATDLRRLDAQLGRLASRCGGRLTVRDVQKSNARKYPTADAARCAMDAVVASGGWRGTEDGRYIEPVRQSDASDGEPAASGMPTDGTSDAGATDRETAGESAGLSDVSDCLTAPPVPSPAAPPTVRAKPVSERRRRPTTPVRLFDDGREGMLPD